jgi:hypothetical protein
MAWRRKALELAEMARESDLLLIGDVQAAKNQHSVLVHPRLDRRDILDAQRFAGVDPNDLSAKHRMQRTDRYGHEAVLLWRYSPTLRSRA